jgi:hypothetical protein
MKHARPPGRRWLVPFSCLLLAIPAFAVIPEFWEVRTYEDWLRGDLDGLSVRGDGGLVLAPSFEEIYDTGEPLVFAAAADASGNVYLGTGHGGGVFRVDPAGTGTRIADLGEPDVLALEVGPDQSLYAATSPNGRVYRIRSDLTVEVFFDPEALYIWDLAFDSAGRLLVATGEEGVIYRVGADGAGEVFYDSENTHILTMAWASSGELIAGGSPRGYLYRISDDGRAFVLYDSGMREVREIALGPDGRIYAAILDSVPSAATSSPGSTPISGTSLTAGSASSTGETLSGPGGGSEAGSGIGGSSGRGPGTGNPAGRILEILPDGAVTTVWESGSEMVLSLLFLGDRLLFSTGTDGRIYEQGAGRRPTLEVSSTEEQTTRLVRAGERILAASSNRGKLWELGDAGRSRGVYTSTVRDTGAISRWGVASWYGEGVEVSTRSGNTSRPDSTWSDWTGPAPSGQVASPPARFVQWRAVLESGDDARDGVEPVLSSLTLPYLQQNFRPDVSSLEILEPGLALRDQQTTGSPAIRERGGISGRVLPIVPRPGSRATVEAGAQALRWSATDQNGDTLSYELSYRAENEGEWKLLAGGLVDTWYTIEPNTLPDGMYRLRLVASDVGTNPVANALSSWIESAPFAIDNTPPSVTITAGPVEDSEVLLDIVATDRTSVLKQAEISVDAGRWRPVFPVDGIVDSLSEQFRVRSGPLTGGEHVVSFRIYDQNENVGIGKAIVRIP